ncbi:heterokaryon incompatibility protein-domain-containing protein, partial [Alternaria rosae]|uniref:heterokaryon incompatibility protein-domain-containing protein n=1 Tax=Alternaria rosae TaxID=1187941 RepID=UPI001E8E9FBF
MEAHEAPHQYQPINSSEDIRVLRLEPGAFAEPLIGSLVVRKIGDDGYKEHLPAYDCVSYCWGPQEHFSSLDSDGRALRITVAVDEMLRYLRDPKEPRCLWIDAICINQADNQEKSQQVRIMDRIYASAQEVRIWLGPATDAEIDAAFPSFSPKNTDFRTAFVILEERFQEYPVGGQTPFSPLTDDFFCRYWFTRRWVLQEVILARVAIVHCGHYQAPWKRFSDGASAIRS